MTELREGNVDTEKGVWSGLELPDGSRSAIISCPGICGRRFTLTRHGIDPAGVVHGPADKTNSVECPFCGKDNGGFHDNVTLIGWKPRL